MNPLSWMFGAGVGLRNQLYNSGVFAQKRLRGPVVSIGNLSVGGTGKTPFTMTLAAVLRMDYRLSLDILSRGYGRKTQEVLRVDPNGSAQDFGDEPLLMASRFGDVVPVIVGYDRYEAGRFSEENFGTEFHLLDDGFQHRRLARDFDIVLLSDDDPDQALLPAGRLREPLSSLARADAVVARRDADLSRFPLEKQAIWRMDRDIQLPPKIGKRAVAFCGIARPQRFFDDLKRHGVEPVLEVPFGDHHSYTQDDVRRLRQLAARRNADCVLTTEKDMANLGSLAAGLPPAGVVKVRLSLADTDGYIKHMLSAINSRRQTLQKD